MELHASPSGFAVWFALTFISSFTAFGVFSLTWIILELIIMKLINKKEKENE